MTDSIEQPAHYDFGMMEAREIIELAIADIPDPVTAYHVATTLKYFLRTSRKGGTEDIAKGCKHAGWALDASRAHDIRKLRDIPPPHYDPDSVALQPRRSESAWSVTWPSDAASESAASITAYQTLVGN